MSHVEAATTGSERATQGDGGLRVWPLPRPALWTLAKGGAVLLVFWTAIGRLFMQFLDDGPVGDADRGGAPNGWKIIGHRRGTRSRTMGR